MEKNKFLATILMIVSLIGIFITVILIYVIPDKKDDIPVETDKDQTNIEVEKDVEKEEEENTEIIDDEEDDIPDFSNYKFDEKFSAYKTDMEFLEGKISLNTPKINLFDDANERLKYIDFILYKNNNTQFTTDVAQTSAYVTKEVYEKTFSNIFGNSYDYKETVDKAGSSMWYNDCGMYPSVHDGNHICFNPGNGTHAPFYFINLREDKGNNKLTVTGEYHILNSDHSYHKYGTFKIIYDISTSNRVIKEMYYYPTN
ncbi:MAG: hypothetical protein IJ193_01595 [Bacilli bacterium]|nr:hypothetical protein [Bacilli bacterium]